MIALPYSKLQLHIDDPTKFYRASLTLLGLELEISTFETLGYLWVSIANPDTGESVSVPFELVAVKDLNSILVEGVLYTKTINVDDANAQATIVLSGNGRTVQIQSELYFFGLAPLSALLDFIKDLGGNNDEYED